MVFSFQSRIVLLFSLLFTGVQALTLATVYQVSKNNVIQQIEQELTYAGRVFDRLLNGRGERMAAEVAIISADFGFRTTVASGDAVTLRSALANLMLRIQAQRAFYIGLDGKVAADTDKRLENTLFPFGAALTDAEQTGRSVSFVLIDNQPYVLATVPVLAPTPIGWIAVAMRIDDRFVDHFKRLSPAVMEITLAEQTPQGLRVLASTLDNERRQHLNGADTESDAAMPIIADSQWVSMNHALPSARTDQLLVALLQIELDAALKPYQQLWYSAAVLFGLGLLGALLGGFWLAAQVSRPIRQLADAVRRVGDGDFSQPVQFNRRDELGRLAQAFNLMMRGIADREACIAYQLRHDALTGLPNRLFFEERLSNQILQGCHYAVVLIGIARYAEINSTLGHELGDQLIGAVCAALQRHMPDDAVLAYLAGDEYALMVNNADDEQALAQLAQQILCAFDEPVVLGPSTVDVSAHLGLVHCARDGHNPKQLLRKADAALFVARKHGRHYHIYKTETDPCQPEALSLMGELRFGLESEQFRLYVQPQLDLKLNRITHVECLIRWQHPERGFMPPDSFIPLAEQTGQIHRVTAWVLKEAFRLRHEWRQAGMDVKLAVNLSTKDLLYGQLVPLLDALLGAYPVEAGDFILEITESAMMQDAELALTVLENLRGRGFLLAVDDFGTGYSSMAYLKKLPLHELKIDKAFVLNLSENQEDAVIVRSIVELGHNLGFYVVAEGLENAASLTELQRLGCDFAQGYWLSKPMQAVAFQNWLDGWAQVQSHDA